MITAASRPAIARFAVVLAAMLRFAGASAVGNDLAVIIATDDDAPNVGADMAKNSKRMINLIKRNVPRARSRILKIPPANLTSDIILRTIAGLNVAPDDAVLFFFSGHGAYDENVRQTYLMFSRDPQHILYVGQVRKAIKAKGVRLEALVVDCCNNLRPVLARGPIAPGEPPDEARRGLADIQKPLL